MLVEIWSDIACPWCFIGKRRFEKALKNLDPQIPVTVQYASFELSPTTPKGKSEPVIEFLSRHKGIPATRARELFSEVTKTAAQEGLVFNFEIARHGNTFNAHRLVHFAEASKPGLGSIMKERLLSAYFERGESTADISKLVEFGTEIGLDSKETRKMLESNDFAENVQRDLERGRKLGVTGVPFFLIDGKYRISGAESPESMLKVLRQAASASKSDFNPKSGDGSGVCDENGCSN